MAPQPTGAHWPVVSHLSPKGQLPQSPQQPSPPQILPAQLGLHPGTHCPLGLQECPGPHVPQLPPQPSPPHFLWPHFGLQEPSGLGAGPLSGLAAPVSHFLLSQAALQVASLEAPVEK